MIKVLFPKSEESNAQNKTTDRITSIENKVVGLLENRKLHADTFMMELEQVLVSDFGVSEVIYKKKRAYSEACDSETLEYLIEHCDVIVHAIAD
ncbi:MAG: hypothetical protein FI726_07665 [SAR202 cluster bacterium]|nr:hypothetical protein [SAR202 cluster bacterium]|tara:strand:- start:438 stop:719 length:282 start_codon:yes stop_codon:yes gene_type:complete